jgi:NAD/NADP transhydrogenase alpha subunit
MNRSAYNATVAETSDIRQTISQAKHTARLWVKLLGFIGLAAIASAYFDGMTIELVIIAGVCCGASAVLGILNWS